MRGCRGVPGGKRVTVKSATVAKGELFLWFQEDGDDLFVEYSSQFRFNYNTPPDSPRYIGQGQYNEIIPEIDIYAISSLPERREIYFIAIIDVLTHYGVKKQVSARFIFF